MKKLYAPDFPGTKAYFTGADPSTQQNYSVLVDEFDVKGKLWLLLFDHLIISAGHILESPLTYAWLEENARDVAELATKRVILPSLRNDREDLRDFVSKHPRHREEPWGDRATVEVYMERARVLDDVFETAITWSPRSESSWFRDSIAADLERSDSPLRRRLVGVSKKNIETLCERLREVDFLTRRDFMSLVKTYCPTRQRILCRYADVFYHLSGALEKEAYPLLHYNEALLCREKLSHETFRVIGVKTAGLWQKILSSWQVTAATLRSTPLSQIREIRKDSLGKRVRNTWARVVENASMSSSIEETLNDHMEACTLLVQEFAKEVRLQREAYSRWRRQRSVLEVVAWATGGLATVLGMAVASPAVAIAGAGTGILGLVTGGPILDQMEKRLHGTELVLLAARIGQAGSS